jgi:hypothetical protein
LCASINEIAASEFQSVEPDYSDVCVPQRIVCSLPYQLAAVPGAARVAVDLAPQAMVVATPQVVMEVAPPVAVPVAPQVVVVVTPQVGMEVTQVVVMMARQLLMMIASSQAVMAVDRQLHHLAHLPTQSNQVMVEQFICVKGHLQVRGYLHVLWQCRM